jgi:uncharacterized membrane protein YheB (UPF0754 family)
MLPTYVKEEMVRRATEDAPEVITAMMEEVKNNIEEVFDLEDMVVSAFVRDKQLLNDMFIKCGRNELLIIRNFGAIMGGIAGVIQMFLWVWLKDAEANGYKWGQWSLPMFGALVGFGTNWIALKMIFEPTFPVKARDRAGMQRSACASASVRLHARFCVFFRSAAAPCKGCS